MKKKSNKIPLFISEKGVPSRNRFQLFCVLQTISRQLNEWIKSAIYCTNGRADWSGLVHLRLSAVRSSLSTLCVNFIPHCFWSMRAQPLVHQYYINNSDHVLNGRWRLILSPFCTAKEHICIFCFERTKTKQCIKIYSQIWLLQKVEAGMTMKMLEKLLIAAEYFFAGVC